MENRNSISIKGGDSYESIHKMCPSKSSSNLMQSYYLYSAFLALKLLALVPLAAVMCNRDKVQRANISDLKHLTPFWLVSALYMTTSPDEDTALALLRLFAAARVVAAIGYITRIPRMAAEAAFFVSFGVTSYMAAWVVFTYRDAL